MSRDNQNMKPTVSTGNGKQKRPSEGKREMRGGYSFFISSLFIFGVYRRSLKMGSVPIDNYTFHNK